MKAYKGADCCAKGAFSHLYCYTVGEIFLRALMRH